jgi:hypothetical protein
VIDLTEVPLVSRWYRPGLAFFSLLLAGSLGLLLAVLLLPSHTFDGYGTVSNGLQLLTSIACLIVCVSAYIFWSRDLLLIYAGFAFGGWTLANTFWYAYTLIIGPTLMFPTVSEAGFLGVFLFLASGYLEAFPSSARSLPRLGVFAFCLIMLLSVPVYLINQLGLTLSTGVTLLFFLFGGYLLLVSLSRQVYEERFLFAGTLMVIVAHLIYAVRETAYPDFWLFRIVGPLVVLSFCLLEIGLLQRTREGRI